MGRPGMSKAIHDRGVTILPSTVIRLARTDAATTHRGGGSDHV
jgi:hypothetical protein